MRKNDRHDKIKLTMGIGCMFLMSGLAAYTLSWIWMILWIMSMFVTVGCTHCCRWYESMWLFVLTAITSVPTNIVLVWKFMDIGIFYPNLAWVGETLLGVQFYLMFLSYEEIIIGLLGRFIWKKQKNMDKVV